MSKSILEILNNKELFQPPKWLVQNMHYCVTTGSESYGVSSGDSDIDLVGFCIPPKEDIFPHLKGEIPGFGTQHQRFNQWQQHHVKDKSADNEYDVTIYSIVKYFQLVMENNPNMVDSLFTPQRCVRYCSAVGQMVRDNRHLFLHKGSYHKFRGYAYSNLHKLGNKNSNMEKNMPPSIRSILDKIDRKDLKFLSDEVGKRNILP